MLHSEYSYWQEQGVRPAWIPPTNDNDMVIPVKKLTCTAIVPTKSRKSDAGYDLYADENFTLRPEETRLISTGIALAIPDGYAGLIWDRSGLGSKGIHRHAGVVDSSYRGEVKVALSNSHSGGVSDYCAACGSALCQRFSDFVSTPSPTLDNTYFITKGDRIAQILFQKVPHFELVETEELDDTDRGSSGFGSSGR